MPKQLMESHLWKHGPPWLGQEEETWPNQEKCTSEVPELRTFISSNNNDTWSVLHRFSTVNTLQRVVAWCYRFIHNSQSKNKTNGELSTSELQHAMHSIIRIVQRETCTSEIKDLSQGNSCNKHNKLLSLNPFLDSDHILRVGGRLKHSTLTYNQKHPIILPEKHVITSMLIRSTHKLLGHAGPQATLYALRQKYWIINGRSKIRKILHECTICFRMRPQFTTYQMGDLPRERFQSSRSFVNVGIDFCGPFFIKERKLYNRNKVKIYVAVFICLASKAIHLEVVSDLTIEAFCASLKRFFCHREKSHLLLSDNATNFVGASNHLRELYDFIKSESFNQDISKWLSNQEVSWKFIPPRSPHFGGIWEAAVKSFKFHLVRIAKNTLFTFEQFNTLVIEIEGILNSRPLTPISHNPEDLIALTPSHFLIGDSLLSVPESDFTHIPTNRLSAWQHIQKLKRDFWNRWHKEYLNKLNQRSKWKSQIPRTIAVGDLVLIKEDNSPPLNWPMGRVLETHPGKDNIIRVVTIKTITGVYKRNVRSLAIFSIDTTHSKQLD
ncbi:PREDICTED: uncharacterized protein LOC108774103 [Cyphomyrmex costatus]|nr:PREDICTED: uncharacterized protein LOC108774103 [Cyphomyrmex costatus]